MSEWTDMPAHPARPASGSGSPWALVGGLIAGALAIGAIAFSQQGEFKYVAVTFVGVAILIALPLIRNLRLFCLYMILMCAPLQLRLSFFNFPHMGGAGAMYIEAVDPFMLLLLYFQVRDRLRGYVGRYRFPATYTLWAAMILLGLSTVAFGTLRTTAANEVLRMVKLLLLAMLIVNEVVRRRQFQHAVIALMLGVILQSVIALTQFLAGKQLGLGFLGEASDEDITLLAETSLSTREFVYRVGGLLGHANFLGGYLALFLPVAIALLLSPVSRRLKALLAIVLLVGQPTLVLTLSRTGWIDFSIAFGIVLLLGASNAISRGKFLLARVAIFIATIVVASALSPLIVKRLFDADPNAVEFRIKWAHTAWAMIVDNPILGVGLNSYVYEQMPYGEDKTREEMIIRYGELLPAVHNSWLLTWSEQGTIGMALFVAMHLGVIAVALRNLRIRDPMLHALSVGLLGGFVAVMVDGFASFYVRNEGTGRTFWIALALILAIGYWRRANEERNPQRAESFADPDPPQAEVGAATEGRWLPYRGSLLQ